MVVDPLTCLFRAASVIGLIALVACGPRDLHQPRKDPQAVTRGFFNLDEPTLKPTGIGLSGNGRLLSREPLRGINSREHFVIETQDWSSDGVLVLQSHLNDFALQDGVQVEMRRENVDLNFSISTPGYPMQRVFTLENVFSTPFPRLRLRIELHDGVPEGVRLLIWKDTLPGQEELMHPLPFISARNAGFDSRENRWVWRSHGRGVRWGLHIHLLTLNAANREAPYVVD